MLQFKIIDNGILLLCMIFALIIPSAVSLIDPVSMGIAAGVGMGIYGYSYIKSQSYCRYYECCDERSIPLDIGKLKETMKHRLYGQHIVQQRLVPALLAHFADSGNSRKPLVVSFHGTPGTGKNFVSDLIAETMFTKGLESRYVHKFMGRADFPLQSKVNEYKDTIQRVVRDGIAECARSLFIFDEVDKMPSGVFDSLVSLVDYNQLMANTDFSKAIFVFMSNTAGVHISDRLGKLIREGTLREETKLADFEQTLEIAAYNMEGGLKKTGLIEAHVIDHYIPFLPLEQQHVRKCLEAEFRRWGWKDIYPAKIDEIVREYVTYERTHDLFVTSGCKTLEKKVAVAVYAPQS